MPFPYRNKTSENELNDKYGLRPIAVGGRRLYIGFPDEPLTEEEKRRNEDELHSHQQKQEYNKLWQSLVNTLDDKIFLAESLGLVASYISGKRLPCPRHRLAYQSTDDGHPLSERIDNIKTRLADPKLTFSEDIQTLKTLNTICLSRNSGQFNYPESDTPSIFYRAFRTQSHSRYDESLGFRSSKQPLTLPSHYQGALCGSSLVDKKVLKEHCETSQPSDLIALSDSPARIFRLISGWNFKDMEGEMIAVINVSNLLAMNVLFNRTTTLATRFGMDIWSPYQPNGLQWANKNYWVAYRWVPAQCIEFCISLGFLRKACDKKGIGELDYDKQLSLEELELAKMVKLNL